MKYSQCYKKQFGAISINRLANKIAALEKRIRSPIDNLRAKRMYRGTSNEDPELHMREAAEWLVRAQDAGSNRGVSYGAEFGGDFLESYPETTG
jgi:hypothetical protein